MSCIKECPQENISERKSSRGPSIRTLGRFTHNICILVQYVYLSPDPCVGALHPSKSGDLLASQKATGYASEDNLEKYYRSVPKLYKSGKMPAEDLTYRYLRYVDTRIHTSLGIRTSLRIRTET
jgi:hypothetical protein